jgi:pilus assembly protein CpaB
VAVALLLALVGTTAVRSYVSHADQRAVTGLDPVQTYIAQATIPAGTPLKEAVATGLAKRESLPAKTVPAGAVRTISAALGNEVATGTIPAGSMLLTGAFGVQQAQKDTLPLPNGTVAVSVSLGDPQRVGGFVQPGSEIAVFDTYDTIPGLTPQGTVAAGNQDTAAGDGLSTGTTKLHVTRLLLGHVPVLAIGAAVTGQAPANGSSTAANGSTDGAQTSGSGSVVVTVALKQRDAEKLILASQTGTLYLALLNQASQVGADSGANNAHLFR